jgi:hypothetical protein
MLVVTCALSTPLVAQGSLSVGLAATVGGGWQVEGVDVGYLRSIHAGPFRWALIGGRVGAFVDQGAIVGGARGVLGAAVLQTRTGLKRLADVGNESAPSSFGLDVTLEAAAYAGRNTPLSNIGSPWGSFSLLPGLRFGDPETFRFGLVLGPTLFVGQQTDVRPFLGLRFEMPTAHRKRHP